MLDDPLSEFSEQIFQCITEKTRPSNCFLVRKHSEDLQTHGDFSFPNCTEAWHKYLRTDLTEKGPSDGTLFRTVGKSEIDLIESSKIWRLPISKLKDKGRLHIFLDRTAAVQVAFSLAVKTASLIRERLNSSIIPVEIANSGIDITSLRVEFLNETLQSICRLNFPSNKNQVSTLITVTTSPPVKSDANTKNIVCGPVLNAKTCTKETIITKEEYIRIRRDELALIAQHRYGLRLSKESKWNQLIDELGTAVTKFELLQSKPTSPVKINFETSTTGTNKGPAFVLYNCARMETIKRTFNEKVEQKLYPQMPCLDDTDLSLLTQEEEWNLIFNYLLGFPTMLNTCLEVTSENCDFRPQLICNFLYSFAKIFSQYYRKTRILTEPRSHLLPVLFARMHLINALCSVMEATLRILGIKHVPHM